MEGKRGDDPVVIAIAIMEAAMKKTTERVWKPRFANSAVIGLIFLLAAGIVYAQEGAAVIREINGTVEVKAPGATDWSAARPGQELGRNTVVSTGFKSSALIVVGNSTLTVQPLTRLSLEELIRAGNTEKVNVSLRAGRIRADVKPPAGGSSEFTVRSPTATASVRGTAFEFDGIRVRVDEGRVHVSGNGQSGTYVGAGHQAAADVETGRTVSAAETAREELAPALPAGIESAPEIKVDTSSSGDIEAGFDWR
jgi:hypothetical protein